MVFDPFLTHPTPRIWINPYVFYIFFEPFSKKCSCLKDEQHKKCSKVTCKCRCWDKRQSADENMEEEYMEVDELEEDWNFDEDMMDVDDTGEEDNSSISSQECVSDDEYIPFSFEIDDADDFLD